MSIEETKIVFTDVQRLKTSRPLRVMIPKVSRNKSICPYSLLLDYIDRSKIVYFVEQTLIESHCSSVLRPSLNIIFAPSPLILN